MPDEVASTSPEPALPAGWVSLRCVDGSIVAPRDIFKGAGCFDGLLFGPLQGGRDAAGAYMLDFPKDVLLLIVHYLTYGDLPRMTPPELQDRLLQIADAKCLNGIIDFVNDCSYRDAHRLT